MNKTLDNGLTYDIIDNVWNICLETYIQHGFKLSFPKGTDPKKTYQWRYVSAIAKKFVEWDFDTEMSKRFIDIAVKYSKSAGTLCKGLAALHQNNMLDICYKELLSESDNDSQSISSLMCVNTWLNSKIGTNDLYDILIKRHKTDGFRNLTMWYQASRITPLYMSLSRSCIRAIKTIDDEYEQLILPKMTTLYTIRTSFLDDLNDLDKVRNILKQDLLIGKTHVCRTN